MSLIQSIKEIDTELFLFFNGSHTSFLDVVMQGLSSKLLWIPFYLFLLFLTYKHFGKKTGLILLSVGLLILISDQVSVHAFKNVFLRYRPCHNLLLQSKVHLLGGCGGTYGFISSHAANTFALAFFLYVLFKNKIKYFGILMFFWASSVSYSRIYCGVHYPADVFVGAIVGMGIGAFVFKLFLFTNKKIA